MFVLIPAAAMALTLAQPPMTPSIAAALSAAPRAAQLTAPPSAPLAASAAAAAPRSPMLLTMYVAFAGLQVADAHSTLSAISAGGREANPAMQGVVGNPASLIAVKTAAGAATIWMAEKMRKKQPKGALVLMAVLNSAMAIVVAHNYAVR